MRVVRVRAHRAVDVVVGLGDREQLGQVLDARRDGDHHADAGPPRARQKTGAVLGELREIEVAVMVDEHHEVDFFFCGFAFDGVCGLSLPFC